MTEGTNGGQANDRGSWGSRWGFVLAAAGSAVGLGNIWKFPYITGENGGGLFVLIYLFCIGLVGLPIMVAEIMIGRAAQKQPVAAFHALEGKRTPWASVGWLGVIAGFVILSYYIVVAGWSMDYALKSVVNFIEPVEESAVVESKVSRATESMESMRATLVEDRAEREARDPVSLIVRELRPSVVEGYGVFTTALARAGGTDEARSVLLEDEELKLQVEEYEKILPDIERVTAGAREEAQQHYSSWTDVQIRDEFETFRRRQEVATNVQNRFLALFADGWTSSFWAVLFMAIVIVIVAGGISSGIERTCKVLMPLLIGLICVMCVYGMFQPGFGEAFRFVFSPDATKLKASGVLEALGHAFFTLSLGMGAMITYGSYQRSKKGLVAESVLICGFDTVIALLACMMIFPIIFSYGQEPSAGPGLVFVSMPLAFAEIGTGGMFLAIIFFGLLVFAALTSAISLLEVVSSFFIDELGWKRRWAASIVGVAVLCFGILSAFAADPDFKLGSWEPTYGKNFFDTIDYLASNWMLPMGGLLIAVYAGWIMPKRLRDIEFEGVSQTFIMGWLLLIRYVAPILVLIVLAQKVEFLKIDEFF